MDRLYKGVQRFRDEHYNNNKDYYEQISNGQSPDTLFITCSDSRVDPNLMTSSKPGDLFVVKNVGNIIPTECTPWKKTSIATAIEFALNVLKVSHIVVCGHSDCGAMKALNMDLREFLEMPNLRDWLETVRPSREADKDANKALSAAERLEITTKKHIISQLENLKTYPIVYKALKEDKITLHGWYFNIKTGEVYSYDDRTGGFEPISYDEPESAAPADGECCTERA